MQSHFEEMGRGQRARHRRAVAFPFDIAGNEMANTVGGGLSYIVGKLVANFLSFFLGPSLAGTVMGFFIGVVSGLFEDLSIFLQIGEIFEGLTQIGKLIPQLISNPGMIWDMIKNSLYGIINKAFNFNPFDGATSHTVEDWLEKIIDLVTDFFDNWNIDDVVLKVFIEAPANLFNLAFTVTHMIGYIIQQMFMSGGAGFVLKTAGNAIMGSLKAIKSALMASDMVMGIAQSAAKVAQAVAKGFTTVVGDIASKLSGGKISQLSDTVLVVYARKIAQKGKKFAKELMEKIGIKYGDDAEDILSNCGKLEDAKVGGLDEFLDNKLAKGTQADGHAFNLELAVKKDPNKVGYIGKEIKTSVGSTDIDVLMKNGDIFESKKINWDVVKPGTNAYNVQKSKLGNKIKIFEEWKNPNAKITVSFKGSVDDGFKTWLENKGVIVEVVQ